MIQNKNILLLVGILMTGHAFALDGDIKLTGKIEVGMASKKENGITNRAVEDGGSELDVVGSADIGNGLKALLQVNTDIKLDNNKGTDYFANGDTFVGLQGDFGTVKLGRGINAYGDGYFKANLYAYDVGPDRGDIASGGGSGRGAFKYEAPNLNGLALSFSYSPGEDKTTTQPRATDAWAASGTYEQGMFGARLSVGQQKVAAGGTLKDTLLAFKVMPAAGLTLATEFNNSKNVSGPMQKSVGVYAEYKPQRVGVRAGYINTNDYGYVNGGKHKVSLLGADYDLSSKESRFQTSLLVEFKSDKKNGNPRDNSLFAGVHIGF
ncbi:porin [Vogesella oryzae]|uniref:porin n=1 Tax=Vogesella oryzae TaxID=1735285 RepID=UPI0015823F87|nr:porin [Vogesella oryzae]